MAREAEQVPLLVKGRRGAGSANVAVAHSVGGDHDERLSLLSVELDEGPSAKAVWVGTGSLVAATEAMHNPGEGAARFVRSAGWKVAGGSSEKYRPEELHP